MIHAYYKRVTLDDAWFEISSLLGDMPYAYTFLGLLTALLIVCVGIPLMTIMFVEKRCKKRRKRNLGLTWLAIIISAMFTFIAVIGINVLTSMPYQAMNSYLKETVEGQTEITNVSDDSNHDVQITTFMVGDKKRYLIVDSDTSISEEDTIRIQQLEPKYVEKPHHGWGDTFTPYTLDNTEKIYASDKDYRIKLNHDGKWKPLKK